MAHVTLCSDGADISDQVFTIELTPAQIPAFVNLVKAGGTASGLIKPSVIIRIGDRELEISERNGWQLDLSEA